jgi:AmmeMemoRadiSam system protein A
MEDKLSDKAKIELLKIARLSIEAEILKTGHPDFKISDEKLEEKRGMFVTLTKAGRLRGCIGHVFPRLALWEATAEVAVSAATSDPRFWPVTKDELDKISIELSVLSPLRQVKNIDEVKIGLHGLYIKRGAKAGVLLPQVAIEHEWDAKTFLEYTCQKAWLPADAWKEQDTEIYVFTAEVFGEEEIK